MTESQLCCDPANSSAKGGFELSWSTVPAPAPPFSGASQSHKLPRLLFLEHQTPTNPGLIPPNPWSEDAKAASVSVSLNLKGIFHRDAPCTDSFTSLCLKV